MYYEDFFIETTLGGIVRWCRTINIEWDRHLKCFSNIVYVWLVPVCKFVWGWRLLYYKVKNLQYSKGQVQHLQRLFYTVGVMSRDRGLHFNYCKRWRNYNS